MMNDFEPIMEKSRSDCMAREEPPQAESGSHCVFLETTLRRFPAERVNPLLGSEREPALKDRAGI